MVVLISLPEVRVPGCRATSGSAGDLWLQGTWKRKQGDFKLLQTILNHANSDVQDVSCMLIKYSFIEGNAFTKLDGDLDVTVRCGRFKPLLSWTST